MAGAKQSLKLWGNGFQIHLLQPTSRYPKAGRSRHKLFPWEIRRSPRLEGILRTPIFLKKPREQALGPPASINMEIPFFKPHITEAEIQEVVDTLRSGWLT